MMNILKERSYILIFLLL